MRRAITRMLVVTLAISCCLSAHPLLAQTAAAPSSPTRRRATYTDGTNSYSTVSNTVTVTVANVSGLRITPDDAVNPAVVPGDTNAFFLFTVTNTGNFADQVRFLASGQSLN